MHASARISLRLSLGLLTAAAFTACGGDDSSTPTDKTGTGGNTPAGANGKTATLSVLPSPAYSGFDGTHKYQIPLKVNGKTGATWTVDKPELADVVGTDFGAMVTTKGPGSVVVTATLGNETGSTKLEITSHTTAQWDTGDKRYNADKTALVITTDSGVPMGPNDIMYDKDGACTTCHGTTAKFLNVQHTPYQTGGYSDDELTTIFTKGMKPAGVVQRSFIPAFYWGMFHTWNVTDDQKVGLVAYLRSLAPVSQTTVDFPVRTAPDGGPLGPRQPNQPSGGGSDAGTTTTPTTGNDAAVTTTASDAGVAPAADAGAAASDAG